jgi:hypothetical protein
MLITWFTQAVLAAPEADACWAIDTVTDADCTSPEFLNTFSYTMALLFFVALDWLIVHD